MTASPIPMRTLIVAHCTYDPVKAYAVFIPHGTTNLMRNKVVAADVLPV